MITKKILTEINNRCKGIYPDGKIISFDAWCDCILGVEKSKTFTYKNLLLAVKKIFGKDRKKKICTYKSKFGTIQIPIEETIKYSSNFLNPKVQEIINQYRKDLDNMMYDLAKISYISEEYFYTNPVGKVTIKID